MTNELTHEYLLECLNYNPETGALIWKHRPENHFKNEHGYKTWNAKFAHKTAGSLHKSTGYIRISIDYKTYRAHRLAYFHYYGYMPENGLDHKERIRNDNRIEKIREASQQCNIRNAGMLKNNTSGVKGVSFNTRAKKHQAYIKVNMKKVHLGFHKEFDDAVMARWKGEVKYKFPNCNTSSSAYNYLKENNLI